MIELGENSSGAAAQTSLTLSGYTGNSGGPLFLGFSAIMSTATTPTVSGGGGTWVNVAAQGALGVWHSSLWKMTGTPDDSDIIVSRISTETWSASWMIVSEDTDFLTTEVQAGVGGTVVSATQDLAYGANLSAGSLGVGVTCNYNAGTGVTFTPAAEWTLTGVVQVAGIGNMYMHHVINDSSVSQYNGTWSSSIRWVATAGEFAPVPAGGTFVHIPFRRYF